MDKVFKKPKPLFSIFGYWLIYLNNIFDYNIYPDETKKLLPLEIRTLRMRMRITPRPYQINMGSNQSSFKEFNPTPIRYNRLHDLEFDIIADKIRSENLKNQMNLKLSQLKKNINDFIKGEK